MEAQKAAPVTGAAFKEALGGKLGRDGKGESVTGSRFDEVQHCVASFVVLLSICRTKSGKTRPLPNQIPKVAVLQRFTRVSPFR